MKLEWTPLPMKECGYRKLCSTHLEAVVDVGNITRPISRGIVMPIRLIMNCELIADRLLLIQVFLPTTRLQEGSTNEVRQLITP